MPDPVGRAVRRLRVLLHWRSHQAELREEMAQHAALRQRAFEAQGLAPDAAREATSRAMGNMTVQREAARRLWAVRWVEQLAQDLAYAGRSMRRQPLFTAVAILGLAGGLGFGTAAFSAFNALALRGWDVPFADRLVSVFATPVRPDGNRRDAGVTVAQLEALATRATTLDGVFAYERRRPDGTGDITVSPVSASYLATLGVPIALGRDLRADEDRFGVPTAVIVLSHRWWVTRRQSDSAVIGSVERVKGVPFTVVGVAAPDFDGTDLVNVDAWIPMHAMPLVWPRDRVSRTTLAQRDSCCVTIAARLAPGASPEAASAEITALLGQLRDPSRDTLARRAMLRPFTLVGSSRPDALEQLAPVFALIFAGVGVVLMLACANVANLLLARAAAREREIGIRIALGASRGRLIRQLMTESLALAALAAMLALAIARWLPLWIMSVFVNDAVALRFTPDLRVLSVTAALAVGSCVLFGLAPAMHATKPIASLKQRVPLRAVFLSAQVALCTVLLVSAGLLLRSSAAGRQIELGYDPAGVTELMLTVPANEDESVRAQRLATELPALLQEQGIEAAAYALHAPFTVGSARVRATATDPERTVPSVLTSPSYFEQLRFTLLAGRPFHEGAAGTNEVVINALLAEQLGGATRAVGSTVLVDSVPSTVVGVVRTARDVGDLRRQHAAVYRPFDWQSAPRVLLRTSPEATQRLVAALRTRDASLGVVVRRYEWYIDNSLSGATGAATMAAALGALALVLAAIGVFGVFSFWVRQRHREIGIRVALGATPARILRMLFGATGRALGWGLVVGLALSALAANVLRSQLYGIAPLDPVSFALAIGVLLFTIVIATLLPARRALHVEPMEALRVD